MKYITLYNEADSAKIALLRAHLQLCKMESNKYLKIIEKNMGAYERIDVIDLFTDESMHYILIPEGVKNGK